MVVSVATLGLSLDSSGMRAGLNDLKQVERAGNRAADALDNAGQRGKKATDSLRSGFGSLKAALAGLGLGVAIKQVTAINDEYARITGRLKLVTTGTEQLAQVQESLFQVAQKTGTAYADVAELYTRVAQNTKELGLSQQELLGFTETTTQAFLVSGASAQEAAGAIRQLTQALASGVFRGEEFNSVAEQGPRILQALTEALGVTRGELRDMAQDGKLTAQVVIDALRGQAQAIQSEFDKLPRTVSRAMTELENEVKRAIAGADVSPLVSAIDDLKKTLSDPAVLQGLQSIAQGLISLAGLAAKAAGAFGNLGTAIGEALARETGHIVPEEELVRLRELREEAQKFGDSSLFKARTDELNRLIERFPALRETVAKDVGGSVAPVLAFTQNLSQLGSTAAQVAVPLREAAGALIPFRDGKPADAAKKFSEEIEKQLIGMRAVYTLIQQGIPLDEAMTRAKLEEAGASAQQTAEYLKLEAALDRAAEAKKKFKEVADPIGNSLDSARAIKEESDRLEELAAARRSAADGAREELEALGRSYGRDLDDMGRGPAARRYSAGLNEIDDRFLARKQDLLGRLAEGGIDQVSYDEQLAELQSFHEQAIAQWDATYARLEQRGLDFASGFQDVVASYLDSTRNLGAMLANDLVGSIDQAATATSRLAAETLLWGEGGKEAAKAIARSIITDVVSSLIRVGIQYGINAALQNTAIASTTAAAVGSAGTIATAQVGANSAIAASAAPAAAATSLASFGTNIGPALAAIAGAYAAARIFNIGFEDGGYTGNYGTKQVAGVVHGQEYVMNADATRRHRGLLDHLNAGGAAPVRSAAAPSSSGASAAAAPRGAVKILNLWDIDDIRAAILDSDEADEIQLNRISRNGSRYRTAIGAEG